MKAGEVQVITGAAGAIGLACARALATRGPLLLVDLAGERLEQACAALSSEGATVRMQACDVTSPGDVGAVADRVQAMGRFRALVHAAGVSPVMADGRRVLDVDLVGSVRMTDALFPLARQGSSAILIGSIAGYSEVKPDVEALLDDPLADGFFEAVEHALGGASLDTATAYVLAKRGVARLAERLAGPWGAKGGRTIAIAPGLIDTPMGRMELARQPVMPLMAGVTPVKRRGQKLPGRPGDIAAAVAFLTSDEAGFISGCDIRIDGGLVGVGKHMAGAA